MGIINGTWEIKQTWDIDGKELSHSFDAIFVNGKITIDNGKYFGTYSELGSSSYISMGICNFSSKTITSYVGNFLSTKMGGEMTGTSPNGKTYKGVWDASYVFIEVTKGLSDDFLLS